MAGIQSGIIIDYLDSIKSLPMFEDGDEEMYDGDLNEDVQRFEEFYKNGTAIGFLDSDRWEAMIDHFLLSGKYRRALACVEEALTQFSFNELFQLRKAQSLSAVGKLKEAVQILNNLERMGNPSTELLLTKGAVFSQLKDSVNAIKYFKAALIDAEPEDKDEIYLDLALEYVNLNDWNGALTVLKQAMKENPKNEGALYELAFCYDQMGDSEKAIQAYSDFIDENPYSFTAWYNLGNAYLKKEDYKQAIWAYDYSILINDDFGPVYFNLGNAQLSLDKYKSAIESFEKSNEIDGDDPTALCYIGEAYEQLGELEMAKFYYRKSLELAPSLPDAWLGLGIVEDLEGRTREGLVLIHKALELSPENAGIYHVLAGAYEKLEDYENAVENYETALALDPTDTECLSNYIELISSDSLKDALDYLNIYEEENPGIMRAKLHKVGIYWQIGEYEASLSLFKFCLDQNRKEAMDLFELYPDLKNTEEFVLLID